MDTETLAQNSATHKGCKLLGCCWATTELLLLLLLQGWVAGLLLSVLQHMAANCSCGRRHPALTCTTVQQHCSLQFTIPYSCCAFSLPAARLHRLLVLH